MRTLIVYESMFGNTARIAQAIADAMAEAGRVDLVDVSSAVPVIPADVDLLIVGGPTHAMSMSRPDSRKQARDKGAPTPSLSGIREWLTALPASAAAPRFATFDTHTSQKWMPGSAAKSAARCARGRGLVAEASRSFFVQGVAGPLSAGEIERATTWARSLATASTEMHRGRRGCP